MASFKANEIILTLDREARRIKAVQDALVRAGARDAPDPAKQREAEIFAYAADLIARLSPYSEDIRAILSEQPGRAAQALRRGPHGR